MRRTLSAWAFGRAACAPAALDEHAAGLDGVPALCPATIFGEAAPRETAAIADIASTKNGEHGSHAVDVVFTRAP